MVRFFVKDAYYQRNEATGDYDVLYWMEVLRTIKRKTWYIDAYLVA